MVVDFIIWSKKNIAAGKKEREWPVVVSRVRERERGGREWLCARDKATHRIRVRSGVFKILEF